jgi:mono/diheme cytochrome c family protein
MTTLIKIFLLIGLFIIGVISFAYSGLYDVGASSQHSGLANWLLSTTSHASIERRASNISTPDLSSPTLVSAGASDFDAMCVGCHGAPGKLPEAMGQGLNPQAPDLAESAVHMSGAELFWVTKHGIKMTGMPAWGATHEDEALWPVIAFLQKLPELDADGYQALLISAAEVDAGHHDHGDPITGGSTDNQVHEH